jgi:fatty acid-binding protein DegV
MTDQFVISADTGADLGDRFIADNNIAIVPLSYVLI